jgi:hypothetical protein
MDVVYQHNGTESGLVRNCEGSLPLSAIANVERLLVQWLVVGLVGAWLARTMLLIWEGSLETTAAFVALASGPTLLVLPQSREQIQVTPSFKEYRSDPSVAFVFLVKPGSGCSIRSRVN